MAGIAGFTFQQVFLKVGERKRSISFRWTSNETRMPAKCSPRSAKDTFRAGRYKMGLYLFLHAYHRRGLAFLTYTYLMSA